MSFLSTTWLMFTTYLGATARSKRMIICMLLVLTVPLAALLPPAHVEAEKAVYMIGLFYLLQVVAPIVGLIASAGVLSDEVENRTITYVFTRPVPRAALLLGRYLCVLVLVSALMAIAAISVSSVAPTRSATPALADGQASRLLLAAILGGASYSLLLAGLSVFFKRAMVIGIFYLVAMEVFLALVPGSAQKMSIQYYLRGIYTNLGAVENQWLRDGPEMLAGTEFSTPTELVVRLMLFLAFLFGVSVWGLRRRQFVLTS
ncbi:MAG: ABC transporter permease subunit [Planctomycetota bacterium]|nr:ABC transporter permease subunit [Planctomycetota bacterium]